jgi:hypothetical protein
LQPIVGATFASPVEEHQSWDRTIGAVASGNVDDVAMVAVLIVINMIDVFGGRLGLPRHVLGDRADQKPAD